MPGTQLVTPDAASKALQAWDMPHGKVLLRGWTVSDVSSCITELPEYVVAETVRGPGPDVVHVAPAFTCTLLVLLVNYAALLASRDTPPSSMVTAPAWAGAHNPAARRHNVPSGHAVTTAQTGRRSAKTPGIRFRRPWAAAEGGGLAVRRPRPGRGR